MLARRSFSLERASCDLPALLRAPGRHGAHSRPGRCGGLLGCIATEVENVSHAVVIRWCTIHVCEEPAPQRQRLTDRVRDPREFGLCKCSAFRPLHDNGLCSQCSAGFLDSCTVMLSLWYGSTLSVLGVQRFLLGRRRWARGRSWLCRATSRTPTHSSRLGSAT